LRSRHEFTDYYLVTVNQDSAYNGSEILRSGTVILTADSTTRAKRTAGILAAVLVLGAPLACRNQETTANMDRKEERRSEPTRSRSAEATFAAGCFWGVEATFRKVDGVIDTSVGYTGGTVHNPTYKQVCTDTTGHAEAVHVSFDPSVVSYERLLDVFWGCHDPTALNRQGPDIGRQYRSAIFFHDVDQKTAAEASREALEKSGKLKRDIVTEITPAGVFYRAEEYHQRYLEKRGEASCPTHQ